MLTEVALLCLYRDSYEPSKCTCTLSKGGLPASSPSPALRTRGHSESPAPALLSVPVLRGRARTPTSKAYRSTEKARRRPCSVSKEPRERADPVESRFQGVPSYIIGFLGLRLDILDLRLAQRLRLSWDFVGVMIFLCLSRSSYDFRLMPWTLARLS